MYRVDSSGNLPLQPSHLSQPDPREIRRQSSSDQLGALLQDIHPSANGLPTSPNNVQADASQHLPQPPPLNTHQGGALNALNPAQVPGLQGAQAQAPAPPPPTMTLQVPLPGGGGNATWTPPLDALGPGLASRVRSTGTDRVDFGTVQAEIQNKITRGAALAQQLAGANAPQQLNEQNVTDLMWFMQARAAVKTGTANAPDIAFTLPDPHGSFLRSLDQTNSGTHGRLAYQRASTHLDEFQKVQDGSGAPRGINFVWDTAHPTNLDNLLPNGKETVLYQR
jgi:hypothetical protein